jgi:hypothetical protein
MPIGLIMGGDFLDEYSAIVNYGLKSIHLKKKENKNYDAARYSMSNINSATLHRHAVVLLADKYCIVPGLHEVRIWGDANQEEFCTHPIFKTEGIFGSIQSHQSQGTLISANHLTASSITYLNQGRTLLKVFNPNNQKRKIKKGGIVGEFIEENEDEYDIHLLQEVQKKSSNKKPSGGFETTAADLCEPGTNKLRNILKQDPEEVARI